MLRVIIVLLNFSGILSVLAQRKALEEIHAQENLIPVAEMFASKGMCDSALKYYELIPQQFHERYNIPEKQIECLLKLEKFKEARKILKSKKLPEYKATFFHEIISYLEDTTTHINVKRLIRRCEGGEEVAWLHNKMLQYNLQREHIQMLEEARKKLSDKFPYSIYLMEVYASVRNLDAMLPLLIDLLNDEGYLQSVQDILSSYNLWDLDQEYGKKVEKALMIESQKSRNPLPQYKLLYWIHQKNHNQETAMKFAEAIDKLENNGGSYLYDFAEECINTGEDVFAFKALSKIISTWGKQSPLFIKSIQKSIEMIQEGNIIQNHTERLMYIDSLYSIALESEVTPRLWIQLSINYTDLLIKTGEIDRAERYLARLKNYEPMDEPTRGRIQILDGLLKLKKGQKEDAFLNFIKVENANYSQDIADLASFYAAIVQLMRGEVEWAQAKLRVLKASTSRLISNDALSTFLLIADIYDEDSSLIFLIPLILFENYRQIIDTLKEQKVIGPVEEFFLGYACYKEGLFSEAMHYLQQSMNYPDLPYNDISLYLTATILFKENKYEECEEKLFELIKKYPGSIYAQKAKEILEKLRENKTKKT